MEIFQKIPFARIMGRSSAAPVNPPPQPATPPPPPPPPEVVYESVPITSPRSIRQLSIFASGAICFLASTTITRRAIYRRSIRMKPKFYEPNTNPHEHFSPFHDALQALNLATINTFSLGLMGVGGTMWVFDIAGLKEMQDGLRGHLKYDTIYDSDDKVPDSLGALIIASRETEKEGKAEEAKGDDSPEKPT
ncbi:hypothetical protein BS50DRAFT_298005 [Corynespora cassiicola Philippines]|uniref:Altered inheritance of mitochondria protein 11 n=1 Tax=Corynespora cassiicola Philippines TaxID=1448308 RepID=A0A2T2NXR5_CORCC|nr:hypothetical protein BS50DRAFT_298005 [Corynespora cassiicola Philippines]